MGVDDDEESTEDEGSAAENSSVLSGFRVPPRLGAGMLSRDGKSVREEEAVPRDGAGPRHSGTS